MVDGMPPYDLECEAALIGACLYDADQIPACAAVVPGPRAFWREDHGAVWGVMLDMHRDAGAVDLVTLAGELERRGRAGLARHDGALLDGPLADMMARGQVSWNAPAYAERVRDLWVYRSAVELAEGLLRDARAMRDTPAELLSRAAEAVRALAHDRMPARSFRLAEILPDVAWKIFERQGGKTTGLLTGFAELDGATDGLQPADFAVLAARPSMGKTAWALNLVDHAAARGVPSLFVSLEMGNPLLAERLIVARSGVDGHKVRCGERFTGDEAAAVHRAYDGLIDAPIHLVRRPGRSAAQVVNEIRLSRMRDNVGVAVVDYLQLMHGDNPRDNENAALGKITASFKALASDLEIPVVLLSQLNRDLEKREDRRPRMSDLRGSGSIEQDADLVLLLHRPEYFDPGDRPGEADLDLAKNRNGRTGVFTLTFDKPRMRFRNHYPDAPAPPGPAF